VYTPPSWLEGRSPLSLAVGWGGSADPPWMVQSTCILWLGFRQRQSPRLRVALDLVSHLVYWEHLSCPEADSLGRGKVTGTGASQDDHSYAAKGGGGG